MNHIVKTLPQSPWDVLAEKLVAWQKLPPKKRLPSKMGKRAVVLVGRELLPSELCDHINGNKLDSRRENIRIVTRSGNQRNLHKPRGSSGFFGVTFCKDRKFGWCAKLQCRVNGVKKRLFEGHYKTPVEAAIAYDEAAKQHGFYTRNFDQTHRNTQ